MKLIIFFALLLIHVDSRSLPDDEESDYEDSEEISSTNVACRVEGTSLKICRECDQRYQASCLPKSYSDCRCRDISYICESKNFLSHAATFWLLSTEMFCSKQKYVNRSAAKTIFWRFLEILQSFSLSQIFLFYFLDIFEIS